MSNLDALRSRVRTARPLIHCITNPISIHGMANAILAVGARPIMAEHPAEVADITATAGALLLNLGSITETRMAGMREAARTAAAAGVPIVLDAVGVACSRLRRRFVTELAERVPLSVIKGNYAEIMALDQADYRVSGVDTDHSLDPEAMEAVVRSAAKKHQCVILASGAADLITDGRRLVTVENGTPQLAEVTGTGCLLGALTASYRAAAPPMEAAVAASLLLGVCGELSGTDQGPASFLLNLFDALAVTKTERIEALMKRRDQSLSETADQGMKRERTETMKKANTGPELKTDIYVITDRTGLEEAEFLRRVEAALKGGASLLQLREKELSTAEYVELARKVLTLSRSYKVPLIIDDRVDVALAVGAEGVHLGRSDLPVDIARKLLGPEKIVGATAKTPEQARKAYEQGADYLGVGAIRPTSTKVKTVPTSTETLREICATVPIPVNAIGGLHADNIDCLAGIPIAGICVVSAVMKAEDPAEAVRELRRRAEELGIL